MAHDVATLRIGDVTDPAEREADQFADAFLAAPAPPAFGLGGSPVLRRKTCEACDDPGCTGDCHAAKGGPSPAAQQAPASVFEALAEPHRSLDPSTRARIERGLGQNLDHVRVHDGPAAARSSAEIGASAWTVGSDIAFAAGAYRPGTPGGDRLIAHEVAHVLQAGPGNEPAVLRRDPQPAPTCPPQAPTDLNRRRGVSLPRPIEVDPKHRVVYLIFETYRAGDTPESFAQRAMQLWVPWRFGRSPLEAQAAILGFFDAERKAGHMISGDIRAAVPGCNYAIGLNPEALARAVVLSGEAQKTSRLSSELEPGPEATGRGYELPALPAEIVGLEIQPIGSTGTYVMRLDWAASAPDLLGQAAEAYLGARYQWEVWDVTSAPDVRAAEQTVRRRMRLTETPKAGARIATRGAGASRDLQRADEDLAGRPAQIDADQRRALAEGRYVDAVGDEINRATLDLEKLTRYGRELLGGAADLAGDDRDRRIPWMQQGVFVVRSIARVNREEPHTRAPSVATKLVVTRTAEAASLRALDLAAQQAAERRDKLTILNTLENADPGEVAKLQAEAERLELRATGTPLAIVEDELADAKVALASARGRNAALLAANLNPPDVAAAQERVAALENQRTLILRREREMGGQSVSRLDAAFVSRVTGETYPLLLQLGEPRLEDGRWYCPLSDVTTADTHLYPGTAPGAGDAAAAKRVALWSAVDALAETSEYGDGSLTVRLPRVAWLNDVPQAERVRTVRVRFSPRGIAGARARLAEVATALAVLGLLIAAPGIGVAGGLLAAGLAADSIARRWREGTLRPDAQLVGDLLDVLGAVAIGARLIGSLSVLNRAGGGIMLRAIRTGAAGLRGIGKAADLAGDVGGIIVANAEVVGNIMQIGEEERSGGLSPSEARRKLASVVASALQSNALAIAGHLSGERAVEGMQADQPPSHGAGGAEPRGRPHPEAPPTHPARPEAPAHRERASGEPGEPAARAPDGPPRERAATMSGAGPPESSPPPATPRRPPSPGQEAHDRWVADTLESSMGRRPPPLPRPDAPPVAYRETVAGLTTMEQALRVYDDFRARAPGREVGIWRSADTGEYAVVAGREGSVPAPSQGREGEWGNVLHNHPNRENVLVYRNPAPMDVYGTWQEAMRSERPVTALIEHDLPDGGRAYTALTVTPEGKIRIEFRRPGAPAEAPRDFANFSDYSNDWGSRKRHVEPGSSGYRDLMADVDDFYRTFEPSFPNEGTPSATMAGTGPRSDKAATPATSAPREAAAPPTAVSTRSGKPRGKAAPKPARLAGPELPGLMTDAGALTKAGLDFVRRRFKALRDLPEDQVQGRFAQGGGPLEAVVRAEIEAHYRQTGETPTSFPIFALDFRSIAERLSAAAQAEGGARRIDGSVAEMDVHRFLQEARANDPAIARLWSDIDGFANDHGYRPEFPWQSATRQECRDFLAFRDRDPRGRGRAFLLGDVGSKIPDAVQVALDFNRLIVIDATAALGNPVHLLKTAFYGAVLRRMVGNVSVEAGDYRSFSRQRSVTE